MTVLAWSLLDTFAGSGVGVLPTIPEGSTLHMDFVEGNYFVGETPVAVETLLGAGAKSSVFNPAEIVPGTGMGFSATNVPAAIGSLLSQLVDGLTSGVTVLCEIALTSDLDGPMVYWDHEDGDHLYMYLYDTIAGNAGFWLDETWGGGTVFAADDGGVTFAGTHKFAATISRDLGGGTWEYAISVDGRTAVVDTAPYHMGSILPGQDAWIGSWGAVDYSIAGAVMRSVTLYSPKTGAELEALTVP